MLRSRRLARYCLGRARFWGDESRKRWEWIAEGVRAGLGADPISLRQRRFCERKAAKWARRAAAFRTEDTPQPTGTWQT
jgi:hypothetical protein